VTKPEAPLFPSFLKLAGRRVLLVGGGKVALGKGRSLAEAGAAVTVVAPAVVPELAELAAARGWPVVARGFEPRDLDGVWLAVAAAPAAANREVALAAEARCLWVVAVDDPGVATAYGASVVRRAGVTIAVSTDGKAPALAGLLGEGLEALLPAELDDWMAEAQRLRPIWRADGVPMSDRRPQLLTALNQLYAARRSAATGVAGG